MIRRILTASILSTAMTISGLGVVAHAATAPATTLSGATQTLQTTGTAQTASPTLDCGAGIVGTVCAVVLSPICKDRCAAGSTAAASTAVAAPKLFCAQEVEIVCTVLGLTVCRTHGCPTAPAPQLVAQPRSMRQF